MLGEVECRGAYGFEFRDTDVMSFICFSENTDERYFNVKTKQEVESFDGDVLEYGDVGELKKFVFAGVAL